MSSFLHVNDFLQEHIKVNNVLNFHVKKRSLPGGFNPPAVRHIFSKPRLNLITFYIWFQFE